ncbi:MAG: retroviral-like aspartic protease family protein [Planctomycetes bacterium]|nr:retroviral-like aspartic protease family protein [Planctomycetota bacterium]
MLDPLRPSLYLLAVMVPIACTTTPIALQSMTPSVLRMQVAHVPATLGGEPVTVLLDTGCDRVIVTEHSLRRLGLEPAGGQEALIDITGTERGGLETVELRDLRIGGMELVPFSAIVLPPSPSGGAWMIDLVAGMPVMANGAWLFDVQRSQLRILDADLGEAKLAELGYEVVSIVPLSGRMRPRVEVTLNGRRRVSMLLDTGAAKTIVPADDARAMALPDGRALARERTAKAIRDFKVTTNAPNVEVRVKHAEPGQLTGVFGTSVVNGLHRLQALRLGSFEATDLLVQSHESEGLLGQDVLSRVPWLLNCARGHLCILARREVHDDSSADTR